MQSMQPVGEEETPHLGGGDVSMEQPVGDNGS